MKDKNGFTLVEILTVIAVIAIIATIGVYTITKIIYKARVKALTDTAFAARKATILDISNKTKLNFVDGIAILDLTPGDGGDIPRGDDADIIEIGKDPWGNDYKQVIAKITKIDEKNLKIDIYFTLKNDEVWLLANDATEMVRLTNLENIANISGNAYIGSTLSAGETAPADAEVTYQWQSAATANGTYTNIAGATNNTYQLTSNELNKYIRVQATAQVPFNGVVNSESIGIIKYQITSVANITGSYILGSTLTAGAVSPVGATFSYQWQRAATSGGTYTDIPGATSNTYTTAASDVAKYLKVKVTATGDYTGVVNSNPTTGPIIDPLVASFNFESNGLSGWTYTGTWIPTIINTITDPVGSALSGTYSVDLKANYAGSVSCTEHATFDTIMYRDFVLGAGNYTFSFKERNSLGSTTYDKTRITIYNVTDSNAVIKEWSTAGCGAGTLATGTGINFGTLTTYTHNFTIASTKTIRFYARAHNGGWQSHLLLDDITLTQY